MAVASERELRRFIRQASPFPKRANPDKAIVITILGV
jgi:hypothetical protein